jgi:hypothetical protein
MKVQNALQNFVMKHLSITVNKRMHKTGVSGRTSALTHRWT